MMRPSVDLPESYLCRSPVVFRKGIQSLAVLVGIRGTVYVISNGEFRGEYT